MGTFYVGTKKVSDFVEKLTRIVVVPVSLMFMIMVFMAVISRFVLKIPIVAGLEYSRIGFVWFCMLGSSLAYKTGSHVKFTFLTDRVSKTMRQIIAVLVHVLCLVFFIVMFIYAVKLNLRVAATTLPASKLSLNVMYLALPVGMAFCVIHALWYIAGELTGRMEFNLRKEEAKP